MKSIEDFVDLIPKTQMSHIYKPVMLQAILKRGGAIKKDGETYRLNLNQNRLPSEACTRRVCKYFNELFLRIFFIFFVATVSGSANLYSISHRSHEIK